MEKTKSISLVLVLALVICFSLVQLIQAKRPQQETILEVVPVWQIVQEGTANPIQWEDYGLNPRFAVDPTDSLVFDKETCLVWEMAPASDLMVWAAAIEYCYNKYLGNRKGWRLPTIEELSSLVDLNNVPTLPTDHPFLQNIILYSLYHH